MKRFSATVAKEKISKLREKYSKSQEEVRSSSDSLISESSHEQKKYFRDKIKIFEKQSTRIDNSIPSYKTKEDVNISKADLESDNETNTQENKINLSDHSFEKPVSSGSLVLSDLSNQFERIRFISSSSEELSIVESINSQTESVVTDLIPSVIVPKLNTGTNFQDIDTDVKRDLSNAKDEEFKTFNNVEENVQKPLKSETESSGSKMSSVKELNSVSETDSVPGNTSLLGSSTGTQYSDTDVISYKNVGSLRKPIQQSEEEPKILNGNSSLSILEKNSLESVTVTPVKETGSEFDKDSELSKGKKSNNSHNHADGEVVGSDKVALNKTSPTTYNKCSNWVSKGTNTEPVKVILLKNKPKHFQHKSKTYKKHASAEKMGKHKLIKLDVKHDFSAKQLLKRQFINPCGLITPDELEKLESNIALQNKVQSLKYSLSDDFYYNFGSSGALKIDSSDEVINQLLKNQIKLTRHFIRSHHDMYLQVCQAAQLLNDNYSSNL